MPTLKAQSVRISEGIILALASAGAYLLSFYYEKGYASVFKIPVSFIEISLTSMLTFGVIIIGVFLFIMPITNLLLMFTLSSSRPVLQRTLLPVILVALLVVVQIYLFGILNWKLWLPFVIMLIVFIFFQFIFPLIVQRGGKYTDKLKAQEETEEQFTDAFVIMRRRFGNSSLIIILVLLLGIVVAESAGIADAINQREFLVTNTNPEMVVLRVYGDNLICAPFDRNTGEVKQSFTVLKIADDANLGLSLENIGPLHVPSTPPAKDTTTPVLIDDTPLPTSTGIGP